MTEKYNTSLEMSYEEKNNSLESEDTSLIRKISIDVPNENEPHCSTNHQPNQEEINSEESTEILNLEKEENFQINEKNQEILNLEKELEKIKIKTQNEENDSFSEKEIKDLNNLLEETKSVKIEKSSDYNLIISLLNYISRNIMKMNNKFRNISAVKTTINYILVELEENKNEKIREMVLKIFNFLFCEGELNLKKEKLFIKKTKEIKKKGEEIKKVFKELKEEVLRNKIILENNFENLKIKNEEIIFLEKKNQEKNEEISKEKRNYAILEEKMKQFSCFMDELNQIFGIQGKYDGNLFTYFEKIKEKFSHLTKENEILKKDDKYEKLKKSSLEAIKKMEEETKKKSEEISKLKQKNDSYKDLLRKMKNYILDLNESNENKEQLIKKQATVIDFFKKSSSFNNLSTDQLKIKIEKLRKKIQEERNEALRIIMTNDLKDYEKMFSDLSNLKK